MKNWKTFFSAACILPVILSSCGSPPPDKPEMGSGTIVVFSSFKVSPDSTFIPDSVGVILDQDSTGCYPNPATISEAYDGLHRICTYFTAGDTMLTSPEMLVDVYADDTSRVDIEILMVAPYAGYQAPELELTDLDGRIQTLSDHLGEVVYLYFFVHT